jgi:hypothetical protein
MKSDSSCRKEKTDYDRDFGNAKRDMFAEASGHPLGGMLITMLLSGIYSYLDGARTQTQRISENLALYKSQAEGWEKAVAQAHRDIHFYFICWHSILQRIVLLRDLSKLATPRKILRRYRKELQQYEEARDHEEHFPDRLYGRKNKKGEPLERHGYLGSVDSRGMYYYGDKSYDVTETGLTLLEEIVNTLNSEMTAEALARIATTSVKPH